MTSAPIPNNELERLHLLHELDILDTEPEPVFDQITALARDIFQVDTAIITLVDAERQWFKSKVGFDEKETPREVSMCTHVVAQGSTMVVNDTQQDERFINLPHVACKDGIRFYAGAPLEMAPGLYIGTLCIIDSQPRTFSQQEKFWLETLTIWVRDELQARYAISNYEQERHVLAQGPVAAVVWHAEQEPHLIYVAENVERVLGHKASYLLDPNVNYESIVHKADRQQLLDRMQALLDGHRQTLEIEYRVLTATNQVRWVSHFARADIDRHGKVLRVRGYLHDSTKRKNLELRLQQANESFELALSAGNLSTWDWDLMARRVKVNHTWRELFGRDERYAINNAWAQLIHPDDYEPTRQALQAHLKGRTNRFEARMRLQHADGHYVWLHSIGKVIDRDDTNKVTRMVGIHHDITEEVLNEQRRLQQEAVLSLVSTVQHEFLFVKDFSEVCETALPQLMAMTASDFGLVGELHDSQSRSRNMLWLHGVKFASDTVRNEGFHKLIKQGLDVEVSGDVAQAALVRGEPQLCPFPVQEHEAKFSPIEIPQLHNALILPLYFKRTVVGMLLLANTKAGYYRDQLATLEPILNTLGTLMHIRRMDEERQNAIDDLRKMATTDELTQVANRRVFLENAEQRLHEFQRYKTQVSVAIIDLDHFKKVNDTHGHAAGDYVLKTFCRVAEKQLREGDLLGRQGGEEFAILFLHADAEQAMQGAERVRAAIAATEFIWHDKVIPVTVSIGVATLQESDSDIDRLLARADNALYRAKSAGRNRCIAAEEV